jgi:membrane dipeptidase
MHRGWPRLSLSLLLLALVLPSGRISSAQDAGQKPTEAKEREPVKLTPEALRIHHDALLIDGHNDLPWQYREKGDLSFSKIDIKKRQPRLHTDIPRLREGGVGAQFWSVYVPAGRAKDHTAVRETLEQIDVVYRMVRAYPDTFEMAYTADDIVRIHKQGKIASLIGVEGGHSIDNSLGVLRMLYALGARYMTLTHSANTDWVDSATDKPVNHGLSPFGEQVVLEMNRLGMLVDISHVSAETMRHVLRISKAPVIASHSSAYAIAQHARNVPDDVLREVKKNGGVVMVNFYPGFVMPEGARATREVLQVMRELQDRYPKPEEFTAAFEQWRKEHPFPSGSVHNVVDHIEHIIKVAGVDHVGLGSDFDGITQVPRQLEDVSCYPNITQVLLDRGYSRDDILKALGGNVLRVLRQAEQVAKEWKTAAPAESSPKARAEKPLEFHVTFSPSVSDQSFTGRVYVLLSRRVFAGLRRGVDWFRPEPMFARDVRDWKAGDTVTVGPDALAHPTPLANLPKDTYWVQAVMDFDHGERNFTTADGNGFSKPRQVVLDSSSGGPIELVIDQVFHSLPFAESERVKLVDVESKLLSDFHHRPTHLRAAVVLPRSFADSPTKQYPVIYTIPGFGGTHVGAGRGRLGQTDVAGMEMIVVVLDPSCRLGHHVFADSENNGPCGRALVEELIPTIERKYRALGVPAARFVTGHSSGGWSSLWLQVTYPDFFGGVWSTAPDPVDFRDFQRINIYQPGANMFTDENNESRPLARSGGKPSIYYQAFSNMEVVVGHGEQLGSFEAVFSPRGADGKPKQLWNRVTGAIDPEVAKSWERYDIRLILERHWKTLGPRLAGKLHVYMGGEDTFYLEGATKRLQESLMRLGSDAVVEIFPGKNHGSLMDAALRQRIAREMAEQFRKQLPLRETAN